VKTICIPHNDFSVDNLRDKLSGTMAVTTYTEVSFDLDRCARVSVDRSYLHFLIRGQLIFSLIELMHRNRSAYNSCNSSHLSHISSKISAFRSKQICPFLTSGRVIYLVDEGLQYFDVMIQDYHIAPRMEHYACVVDLLGRVGRLHEAQELDSKYAI